MIRRLLLAILFCGGVLFILPAPAALAHSQDLAALQVTELGEGRYTWAWRTKPTLLGATDVQPQFPSHCVVDGATIDCGATGLVGRIGFDGVGVELSGAIFRIQSLDGSVQVHTLTAAQPTAEAAPSFNTDTWAGKLGVFNAYVAIGIEHIMLGVDHLLFVLGLMWVASSGWTLFKTITAFTLAHTVSLAAVTFGWIGVSEAYVNALIALSIVFIAVEAMNARENRTSLTLKYPWIVSFFFGLLHGLGFASALVQLGLPENARPLALLAFNVGVEIGQIAFVLLALALLWSYRVMRVRWPVWAQEGPIYAVGGLAALWFMQRVEILVGA